MTSPSSTTSPVVSTASSTIPASPAVLADIQHMMDAVFDTTQYPISNYAIYFRERNRFDASGSKYVLHLGENRNYYECDLLQYRRHNQLVDLAYFIERLFWYQNNKTTTTTTNVAGDPLRRTFSTSVATTTLLCRLPATTQARIHSHHCNHHQWQQPSRQYPFTASIYSHSSKQLNTIVSCGRDTNTNDLYFITVDPAPVAFESTAEEIPQNDCVVYLTDMLYLYPTLTFTIVIGVNI